MGFRSIRLMRLISVLALLVLYFQAPAARAEGSWQMGLFEGLSNRQPLYETSGTRNLLSVDILNVGEVINVHACGNANGNLLRVTIYDPNGTRVYRSQRTQNVDCEDDFTGTFDPAVSNPHQYVTTRTGTYTVHFSNRSSNLFNRFDITVTDNVNDLIDPKAPLGRVWASYWYFWAGAFTENRATDADLYVVADGGFANTYSIWQLDLNNFAGFGYGLKANSLGVNSPNASGDEVAGMSVPKSGNSITEEYPIYLSFPARNYPEPTQTYTVSDLVFLDNDDQDNVITSGGNGLFRFTTNILQTGVYEIIIDTGSPTGNGPDGIYGQGDVYLRGAAVQGQNDIPWDGNDNNGDPLPQGNYTAKLSVRIGEFHFVADDVETSGGPGGIGIKMYKARSNGSLTPVAIYWDKQTVLGDNSPNAFNQYGIYDGDHSWGNFTSGGVGNNTLLDTYSYSSSVSPTPANVTVVDENSPLISVAKSFSPDNIVAGETSTMELEIVNSDTITVTRIKMSDTFPDGMTLVSDPADITVSGSGCTNFQFSAETVSGGNVFDIIGGEITGGSTCLVTVEVRASFPGEYVNRTSGVTSPEKKFGAASNGATLSVDPEPSGAPLSCGTSWYEIDTVNDTTRLYELSNSDSPVVRKEFAGPGYAPDSAFRYTGLAFNPQDNYLYAIVSDNDGSADSPVPGSVVRIDQEGKVVNLGRPDPGPNSMEMPLVSDRFVGGTITAEGSYVVVTDNSATTHTGSVIPVNERGLVLEIDVSTNPPRLLYNLQHGRDVGDIVSHPNGALYSHTATEGLIEIDSKTGGVVAIGGNISNVLASMVADKRGNVYGHTASTNEYVQVDIANGNGTLVSNLTGSSFSDGASCAYGIAMEKTVSATEVQTGNSVRYSVAITNSLATSVSVDFSDQLGDSRFFVANSLINSIGGTVNTYADNNTLQISGASLAANSTSILEFEVFYPPGMSAGTAYNQATIQPLGLDAVVSDFPATAQTGDATPIEVLTVSAVGASKSASVSSREITYLISVENIGVNSLDDMTLHDDLDAVFGPGNYRLITAPVLVEDPGTLLLNGAYTGSGSDTALIESASTLAAGARAVIRFSVMVETVTDRGAGTGVYSNQVLVTANAGNVQDLSVDGDDVDPNNDGIADEESATIVSLAEALVITGNVFNDNGASATAHDGVVGGAEPPGSGVTIELRLNDGSLIDSATTDADGGYQLSVPVTLGNTADLQIIALAEPGYQWISESLLLSGVSSATGSVTDGRLGFTYQAGHSNTGEAVVANFGRIKAPQWLSSQIAENGPDTVVFHSHQYKAYSEGSLAFNYTELEASPQNISFSAVLIQDFNCDGAVNGSDHQITAPIRIDIDVNAEICVINKVYIPADVSHDDSYRTTIEATLNYSDSINSGHAFSDTFSLTDVTRAIAQGEGVLVLAKYVENVSQSGVTTTRNSALPDDVLRYTIDFQNNGSGPVSEVLLIDSTPAFSALEQPVQCPAVLPDGIVNCLVVAPSGASNFAGYQGPVQWQLDGSLSAGASGTVWFEIRIE